MEIKRILKGDADFEIAFSIEKNAYNTFPLHLIAVISLITFACMQNEWNFISVITTFLVAADISLISYRLGYQDMKRSLEKRRRIIDADTYY